MVTTHLKSHGHRAHTWLAFLTLAISTALHTAGGAPPAKTGAGLNGVNYYSSFSPFSDAIKTIRWIDVASWNTNGYPAAAKPGATVSGRTGIGSGESWPSGQYTLRWEGSGEVTLTGPSSAKLVSEDLTGTVKTRVYDVVTERNGLAVEIPSFPVDKVELRLPGLADHASLWNPEYLRYVKPFAGGPLRFMDLNGTNGSDQINWDDRTPRNWSSYTNKNNKSAEWRVKGAASYESMIELCNEVDADMWICVPHKASDDYIRNLASLIKTGIDPATGEQVTEPLAPHLRVWIEYSNEVWNWNFAQSNYVLKNFPGDQLDARYAYRANQVFDSFESVYDGTDRLVRVIGTQTGWGGGMRSRQRLEVLDRSDYDALAVTTYFKYDMHQWIYDNRETATPEAAIDELARRIGSGPFSENDVHEDNEDCYWHYEIGREFDVPVVAYEGNDHINPVGRIDTNGDGKKDGPLNKAWPEAVDFIHTMMRHPKIKEVYGTYLDRHHKSGLRMNMPFVLVANWSQYGQWGHLEYLGQPMSEAPKFALLLDYYRLDLTEKTDSSSEH